MSEDLAQFDNPLEVDRVITEEDAHLFRAHGVLAYLDGPVYNFSSTLFELENPTPVYDDDQKKIGFATVAIENDPKRIVADIVIDYATEARFLAQMDIVPMYARVFGGMGIPAMPLFDFAKPLQILKLVLKGIQLSRHAPADERITKLRVEAEQ